MELELTRDECRKIIIDYIKTYKFDEFEVDDISSYWKHYNEPDGFIVKLDEKVI